MDSLYELPRRARGLVVPTLCTLAAVYFGYHAVQGERGLIAYMQYRLEVQRVEAELALVRAERERLAGKAGLLHPDHVDPDLLDEQLRRILGLAHPDELIVFTE